VSDTKDSNVKNKLSRCLRNRNKFEYGSESEFLGVRNQGHIWKRLFSDMLITLT